MNQYFLVLHLPHAVFFEVFADQVVELQKSIQHQYRQRGASTLKHGSKEETSGVFVVEIHSVDQ